MLSVALHSRYCRRAALAATLLGLLLATPSGAALIEVDLLAPGDGLITLDTDTNLEWLDLTATLNLSYDDIVTGGAGGWAALGFVFATTTEVATLWTNAGIVDMSGSQTVANRPAADSLLLLMGCTGLCGSGDDVQQGQAEFDPAQANLNSPFIQLGSSGRAAADIDPGFSQTRDFTSPTLGNYLVRPIPEPSTALLLGGGLLGLVFSRRRSRRS